MKEFNFQEIPTPEKAIEILSNVQKNKAVFEFSIYEDCRVSPDEGANCFGKGLITAKCHVEAELIAFAIAMKEGKPASSARFLYEIDSFGNRIEPPCQCKYCSETIDKKFNFCPYCGKEQ